MEVKGKIITVLPEVTGQSKTTGNLWKKREYVLETHDNFPRKVHFDLFGDRADKYPLNLGDEITLSFDIESREYQGRWYTSIRGWKVDKEVAGQTTAAPSMPSPFDAPPQVDFPPMGNSNEDLPF